MSFFLVPDSMGGNLQIPDDNQKGRYYSVYPFNVFHNCPPYGF